MRGTSQGPKERDTHYVGADEDTHSLRCAPLFTAIGTAIGTPTEIESQTRTPTYDIRNSDDTDRDTHHPGRQNRTGLWRKIISLHADEAIDMASGREHPAVIHQDRLRDRPEDAGAT